MSYQALLSAAIGIAVLVAWGIALVVNRSLLASRSRLVALAIAVVLSIAFVRYGPGLLGAATLPWIGSVAVALLPAWVSVQDEPFSAASACTGLAAMIAVLAVYAAASEQILAAAVAAGVSGYLLRQRPAAPRD